MKSYLKYILVIFLTLFSFYYMDKVIELSEYNNSILVSINDYALKNNKNCIEGNINSNGIILGYSGLIVNENKSYSNMKGVGFKKELIEYDKDKCILNKEDNLDKYIVSGNKINKNISIVIDIESKEYYKEMIDIFEDKKIKYNILTSNELEDFDNILYDGNNIKSIYKKYNNIYCVKTSNYEIINDCKKYKINSINAINIINKDLLIQTKKILDNGIIIFIKENNLNLYELSITLDYIKSRGYNIVNVDELLS